MHILLQICQSYLRLVSEHGCFSYYALVCFNAIRWNLITSYFNLHKEEFNFNLSLNSYHSLSFVSIHSISSQLIIFVLKCRLREWDKMICILSKTKKLKSKQTLQLQLYENKTWERHVFVFALDIHLEHVILWNLNSIISIWSNVIY